MVFTLLADVDQCPVVIDGAGTLGRQIASVYAVGGEQGTVRPVRVMPADARTNGRTTAYANLTTEVGA
jgi:3-hydroxyacyl-CoA dehydrogenase